MTSLRLPHPRNRERRARLLSAFAMTAAILVSPIVVSPASANETGTGTGTGTASPATTTEATATITVSGTAKVGEVLTAEPGTWAPADTAVAYQWFADNIMVNGATEASLTISPAFLGKSLRVGATFAVQGLPSVTIVSESTSPVAPGSLVSTAPVISGTLALGGTLTATTAPWAPLVELAFHWLRDGLPIDGATAQAYTLTPLDVGRRISVVAVGSADGYVTAEITSVQTTPVPPSPFADAPVPTISGTARVGSLLTARAGTWPSAASLTFQWNANGAEISGATSSTYTPVATVQTRAITVTVTARAEGHLTQSVTSLPTAAVAVGSFTAPIPTITGTARVGSKLTVTAGTWAPTASLTYQWKSDGKPVVGATKSTYTVTSAEYSKAITVTVTGARTGYLTKTRTSAATAAITSGVFTVSPVPKVTGIARVGSTLTATAGTWSPSASISYQWKANGVAIAGAGARKSTYVLTVADHAKRITVTVTGRRTGWLTTSRSSTATAQVARTFATAPTPLISGSARVGSTLTAKAGTWSGTPTLTYQWLRSGKAIAGATRASYTVVQADLNATLSVTVTATRATYVTASRTSATTAKVTPKAPAVCTVKGNRSSSGEWIYHVPGGQYYAITIAEECFATEAQAVAAGYRKSKR